MQSSAPETARGHKRAGLRGVEESSRGTGARLGAAVCAGRYCVRMVIRFATVAEFLAAQTPEVRADVESLRTLVMDAEPRLVEIVKWTSPSYTLDGQDRLTVNARSHASCARAASAATHASIAHLTRAG